MIHVLEGCCTLTHFVEEPTRVDSFCGGSSTYGCLFVEQPPHIDSFCGGSSASLLPPAVGGFGGGKGIGGKLGGGPLKDSMCG